MGEVIADAIAQGCRRFLVGIGGSATNDGGAGMLQALGFGLLDAEGRDIPRGAQGLKKLARIETAGALPALAGCRFRVACDVTNPLCGEKGASAVFGPQKGARPADIPRMDAWLAAYAQIAAKAFPGADPEAPGTGAAGGLGFAFRTFLSGELEPGVQIVLEETRLAEALAGADVVVTGEGRLDGQTAMGKAPVGVARLAKARGCLVLALAGGVTRDAGACNGAGIDAFFPAVRGGDDARRGHGPGKRARKPRRRCGAGLPPARRGPGVSRFPKRKREKRPGRCMQAHLKVGGFGPKAESANRPPGPPSKGAAPADLEAERLGQGPNQPAGTPGH